MLWSNRNRLKCNWRDIWSKKKSHRVFNVFGIDNNSYTGNSANHLTEDGFNQKCQMLCKRFQLLLKQIKIIQSLMETEMSLCLVDISCLLTNNSWLFCLFWAKKGQVDTTPKTLIWWDLAPITVNTTVLKKQYLG